MHRISSQIFILFLISICVMSYGETELKWGPAEFGSVYWFDYYRSYTFQAGYQYKLHLFETGWQLTPPYWDLWFNQVLIEKPDGTNLMTFNDLTQYNEPAEAWAAGEHWTTYAVSEDTPARVYMHKTAYPDHLGGHINLYIYKFPIYPNETHLYSMSSFATPAKIPADGSSSCDIFVQLYKDGQAYGGQDGSEWTEYIQVTTDKGSFSEYDDEKDTWMFYSGNMGSSIPLYSDTEQGTAHITLQWHAYQDNPIIQYLTVNFGDYALTVTSDEEVLPADGSSTAQITVSVDPYSAQAGDIATLTTDRGSFAGGSQTVEVLLDASGIGTTTFIAPDEQGFCHLTGTYVDAEDTVRILAQAKQLMLSAYPDNLPADSHLQSNIKVKLLDEYFEPLSGETVTLTTNIGNFENGLKTMVITTDWDATEVLFHPEDGVEGTANITASYEGTSESLSASDTVDLYNSKLLIQVDPEVLEANGTDQSEIIVTLFSGGKPASQDNIILLSTSAGSLSDGQTSGSALSLPTNGAGMVSATLTAANVESTAILTAEYIPAGISATKEVEMMKYKLKMVATQANYHSVTDTSLSQSTMRTFDPEQEEMPEATSLGLTKIPVTLYLTGADPDAKKVNLTSNAKIAITGDSKASIIFPDYVWVYSGTAQFTVQINNLYEYNEYHQFDPISGVDIIATLDIDPEATDTASFPVVNNRDILLDLYKQSLPVGAVYGNFNELNPLLKGLVYTGVYSGAVNNGLSNNDPRYNAFTCGGYQVQSLHFLDDLRLNHPEYNWLLNGLDYGPVKQLNGAHQAACIWPSSSDNWGDPVFGRVLDPWISQDPERGVYTWTGWLSSIGIAFNFGVGVALEIGTDAGSSVDEVQAHYPNTGNDYPNTPYWEFDDVPAPSVSVIVDCPVNVIITDTLGRKSGFDETAGSEDIPLTSQIPGLNQYPTILPNGSKGWYFEIPHQTVTMELKGYDAGNYTLYLMYPSGQIVPYSQADIGIGQTVSLVLDPNGPPSPEVVYGDGSVALPDNFLTLDPWHYNSTQMLSENTLTITNQLNVPVYGPMKLVFHSFGPQAITLANPDGTESGNPYLDFTPLLTEAILNPGQSIQRDIAFENPNKEFFDPNSTLTCFMDISQTIPARANWVQEETGLPVCGDANHPYPQHDLNYDCRVNLSDIALLAEYWLAADCEERFDCYGRDIFKDGSINILDVTELINNWLQDNTP